MNGLAVVQGARLGKQLDQGAFMHVRALAQVKRGKVKPEHLDGLTQLGQAQPCDRRIMVLIERGDQDVDVTGKFLWSLVRR